VLVRLRDKIYDNLSGKTYKSWWYDPRNGSATLIGEFPRTEAGDRESDMHRGGITCEFTPAHQRPRQRLGPGPGRRCKEVPPTGHNGPAIRAVTASQFLRTLLHRAIRKAFDPGPPPVQLGGRCGRGRGEIGLWRLTRLVVEDDADTEAECILRVVGCIRKAGAQPIDLQDPDGDAARAGGIDAGAGLEGMGGGAGGRP